MTTVRFGTICDLCGAGSRDYAHDANRCSFCEEDLCDSCAVFTKHTLVREEDEGQCKRWDCEDRPVHTSRMDALADAETLRLYAVPPLNPISEPEHFNVYANLKGAERCGNGVLHGLRAGVYESWVFSDAYLAARAAFRAVPGLREEAA